MYIVTGNNEQTVKDLHRILHIFQQSEGHIRPHFILSGTSGSGKSYTISQLIKKLEIASFSINAAQLTREGYSGASLSKVMEPLAHIGNTPCICFVDEFDKMFIDSQKGGSSLNEVSNTVQDEFLKLLDGGDAHIIGQFGHYLSIPVDKCLFIFAGAFNNRDEMKPEDFIGMGLRREFLGRVPLHYHLNSPTEEDLKTILKSSTLLEQYLGMFQSNAPKKSTVVNNVFKILNQQKKTVDIGARAIDACIHKYFISLNKPN